MNNYLTSDFKIAYFSDGSHTESWENPLLNITHGPISPINNKLAVYMYRVTNVKI